MLSNHTISDRRSGVVDLLLLLYADPAVGRVDLQSIRSQAAHHESKGLRLASVEPCFSQEFLGGLEVTSTMLAERLATERRRGVPCEQELEGPSYEHVRKERGDAAQR